MVSIPPVKKILLALSFLKQEGIAEIARCSWRIDGRCDYADGPVDASASGCGREPKDANAALRN
jgi:hypothetical protein